MLISTNKLITSKDTLKTYKMNNIVTYHLEKLSENCWKILLK